MGLTWRDLVSAVTALVMILAYVSFALGTRFALLSTAWAASAVELVLATICAVIAAADLHIRQQEWPGVIFRRITTVLGALCAVTAAADLHTRPQERLGVIFRRITSVLGAIALLAGLVASNRHLVEIVVVSTTFLWLTACIWHVLSIGSELDR